MVVLMGAILIAGLQDDLPLAEHLLDHRLGRDVPRVRRAARSARPPDFENNFNALNAAVRRRDDAGRHHRPPASAGIQPNPGDMNATLPTVFMIMTFMMWNWWSVYLSGELKSASNRGRQLSIMFGALVWDVVFIALGAAPPLQGHRLRLHGRRQHRPATPPTPSRPAPWYHFLASLVYNAPC